MTFLFVHLTVYNPPPPPPFLKGESKFWLPLSKGQGGGGRGGGWFWKIQKGGGSMVQGQVFLREGAGTFPV